MGRQNKDVRVNTISKGGHVFPFPAIFLLTIILHALMVTSFFYIIASNPIQSF